MKVVVDATMLDGGPSGAATRLSALDGELARNGGVELLYLVRPGVDVLPGRPVLAVPGLDTPFGRARAGARLDRLLHEQRAAVFAAGALPLARVTAAPTVATIHDLRFLDRESGAPWLRRLWGRHRLAPNLARAAALVAVSETTAARLQQLSPVPVSVVPNAGTPGLRRVADPGTLADFRRRAGLNRRYALALGPLQPHKAPGFLLEVLAAARAHPAGADLGLVLAGRAGPEEVAVVAQRAERLGLAAAVRFVGVLTPDELATALSGADALLAVGRSEGFGIPVVDAQALGVPVVAVAAGALPEVAGDGAWLAAPDDVAGCAAALLDATTPSDLGEARRQRGLVLAARWSWARSAQQLAELWVAVARDGAAGARR